MTVTILIWPSILSIGFDLFIGVTQNQFFFFFLPPFYWVTLFVCLDCYPFGDGAEGRRPRGDRGVRVAVPSKTRVAHSVTSTLRDHWTHLVTTTSRLFTTTTRHTVCGSEFPWVTNYPCTRGDDYSVHSVGKMPPGFTMTLRRGETICLFVETFIEEGEGQQLIFKFVRLLLQSRLTVRKILNTVTSLSPLL